MDNVVKVMKEKTSDHQLKQIEEKGWLYCSGLISDYGCRQRTTKHHWHKVYETDSGKSFIEWESRLEDDPGFNLKLPYFKTY
jgi:hypothetical protein